VANLNLDLLPMLYRPRDVVAYGADHSSLADPLERAARRLGLKISPDPWPEQSLFVRSDQYSFVQRGVPALFLAPGFESHDPELDGGEVWRRWLREVYHSPGDDFGQPLDFEGGALVARLGFLVGLLVAEADAAPRWNEGDFFAPADVGSSLPANP
jgi:Zn-dependent M28 family amino/carboxypeptidase